VPSYVTFITGLSFEDASRARRTALTHALLLRPPGFTMRVRAARRRRTTLRPRARRRYRDVIAPRRPACW
jgi:hypothetical protein